VAAAFFSPKESGDKLSLVLDLDSSLATLWLRSE
jgi:hypothetical protein